MLKLPIVIELSVFIVKLLIMVRTFVFSPSPLLSLFFQPSPPYSINPFVLPFLRIYTFFIDDNSDEAVKIKEKAINSLCNVFVTTKYVHYYYFFVLRTNRLSLAGSFFIVVFFPNM